MAFSPYAGGPITLDHENTVKAYSASPSMLGRGHTLFEPQGPVWVRLIPCLFLSSLTMLYNRAYMLQITTHK